jgi:hypothetical protein
VGGLTFTLADMDVGNAWWGISRDLDELRSAGVFGWTLITVTLSLPTLAILLIVFARSWLALIPLAIAGGLFALWFLYYATDWVSNPGQGVWVPGFFSVLVGWAVIVAALHQAWSRRLWALPFRRRAD